MEEINLMEVFSYFKAKIVTILMIVVVVMILGNVYTIVVKEPMYQSNTTILLVNEDSQQNISDLQLNKNLISTYSEIIKSRKVLNQVIKVLNLDYSVQQLSKNITVSSVQDTEIIKITVSDRDKEKAAVIANQISETFSKEIKGYYHLENISIIDKAIVANGPYNINLLKDNIIFLLIGAVLAFGIIFVIYYFDTSIKSSEVIESKLGLTVLGIVPKERGE
ncbi:MAG: hypothetical protein IKO49_05005 [Bacilli bacterium]|nr:hypothetical protein [Bacilli bacterium]